ncbi:MAG: putative toxin-antitoxin system toxin component, PIN family [Bacteroidales bacterium]|nr:putative toxin-antitoxin system toxin component, PIN family [Candidatus Scybalocola fimicaballi]
MFAVIDTNVFVSALITKNPESPTRLVYDYIDSGDLIPLYNDEIIAEYREVLSRPKFKLRKEIIDTLLSLVVENGISSDRFAYEESMIDEKDRVFYEVSLSVEDSFLVTGNLKHFPSTPMVVTPFQIVEMLSK